MKLSNKCFDLSVKKQSMKDHLGNLTHFLNQNYSYHYVLYIGEVGFDMVIFVTVDSGGLN